MTFVLSKDSSLTLNHSELHPFSFFKIKELKDCYFLDLMYLCSYTLFSDDDKSKPMMSLFWISATQIFWRIFCLSNTTERARPGPDQVMTKTWRRFTYGCHNINTFRSIKLIFWQIKFGKKCKCFEWMCSYDMLLYPPIITQILFLYFSPEINLYCVVNTLLALPGAVGLMSNYTPWTRQGCVFRRLLWRPYRFPLPPKLLNSVILSIKYLYYYPLTPNRLF